MELLLIRHAEPRKVVHEPRAGTPADPALSDTGLEQARRLARWIECEPVDAVCVSPLRRARETAEMVAGTLGLTPEVRPGLSEFDARSSSYVTVEELAANGDAKIRALIEGRLDEWGCDVDFPTFARRVVESVEEVIADHPGKRVAAVCHGGIINVYLAHVLGMQKTGFWLNPQYTSISRIFASKSGVRTIASVNETGHLVATHDGVQPR